jgi:hypothetical protein
MAWPRRGQGLVGTGEELAGGLRYEAEEVRGIGDCTVAKLLVTGRAGGVAVPQSMWCATRIRNRRAIWWGVYRTEAEALRAAGLSE